MARIKNISPRAVFLNAPERQPDAHEVQPGDSVKIQGQIMSEDEDAIIVGSGPSARAYSKKMWQNDEKSAESSSESTDGDSSETTATKSTQKNSGTQSGKESK